MFDRNLEIKWTITLSRHLLLPLWMSRVQETILFAPTSDAVTFFFSILCVSRALRASSSTLNEYVFYFIFVQFRLMFLTSICPSVVQEIAKWNIAGLRKGRFDFWVDVEQWYLILFYCDSVMYKKRAIN